MRLMFAYHIMALQSGTVGSAQDLYQYAQAAKALGNEVVIYGPPDPTSPFDYSMDTAAADALVCVFEWTSELRKNDQLDFIRLLDRVPRKRRVLIDCDGAYNDTVTTGGDYNHRDAAGSRRWMELCDSLTDKICQPTSKPFRANVRPFLFYGYNPNATALARQRPKPYGMVYVGHSKFRWHSMEKVLRAIEPIRKRVGRIALVGHGWDELPPWTERMQMESAFYTDKEYLRKMDLEFVPSVRFEQVIPWMSRATFSPVLMRPTFEYMKMVTPRLFETLTADTIPVFGFDPHHVCSIYGAQAAELILPAEQSEKKIEDILNRPEHYAQVVENIRGHLAAEHSHTRRFQQLLEIVES